MLSAGDFFVLNTLFYIALGTVLALGIAGVLTLAVLLAAAGALYGENRAKSKWIVENRRRERRDHRTIELWQSKAIERAGLGSLHPRPWKQTETKPARQIVAPSTVINDLKKEHSAPYAKRETVPPAIKQQFLEGAGKPA